MLERIWRQQPGDYFCLSGKTARGLWHDEFFSRSKLGEVREYIRDHKDRNLYFCPHGFSAKRRRKNHAVPPHLMWSDMDDVDPEEIELRPTVAIESSPGRYVGLWLTDRPVGEELNRRLSYSLGADKSGWDFTQVLRCPGTINYKYPHAPRATLLWSDGPTYRVRAIERALPADRLTQGGVCSIDWEYVATLGWRKLAGKYRMHALMRSSVEKGRRSDVIMWLAGQMRNRGATDEEIAAVIPHSAPFIDKFGCELNERGRNEIKRVCARLGTRYD